MSTSSLRQAFLKGDVSAEALVQSTLKKIRKLDPQINAFTALHEARAMQQAAGLDQARAAGRPLGPLAGMTVAVKNLFDVEGQVTLAGSAVLAKNPPATSDAFLLKRLSQAGAILIGSLNMDEFAYGFTTENSHVGPTRNPRNPLCVAGGSSGGSGAALAAEMVDLTLGSDTNGSIRVPSSFCGVWGLKPTYGRLSRRGSYPFVHSLDHLGPMANHLEDLAHAYDEMQSPDPLDFACAQRAPEPVSAALLRTHQPTQGEQRMESELPIESRLRFATLGGYFESHSSPMAKEVLQQAVEALQANASNKIKSIELPMAELGRAAAFIITGCEGGQLHLHHCITQYDKLEPLSRDRFIAGSLIPSSWYLQAQRVRSLYRQRVMQVFQDWDILITPATPVTAPEIGTEWLDLNGKKFPARASVGLLTQPISCLGLPVLTYPMLASNGMPLGLQLIAAPWREDQLFQAATKLRAALG